MDSFEIKNNLHQITPLIVGNGNPKLISIIGNTNKEDGFDAELEKADFAVKYGSSMLADVSTKGNISNFLKNLTQNSPIPVNTVPLYEIFQIAKKHKQWNKKFSKNILLDIIQTQAENGIDCMTFHSSLKKENINKVIDREIGIQARGGSILYNFMQKTNKENPLHEYFEEILSILKKNNITLSLGSSMRTGTINDPIDNHILDEIQNQISLARTAQENGVNVIIEGLSHISYKMIEPYVKWMKEISNNIPLRLLGPLGTEKGLGYDHITAAISATKAIEAGTDLITCITRSEHIGLPNKDEIRESLIAYRIAIELALQKKIEKVKSNFTCGLGFENLSSDYFFDLEKAIELKLLKNNGNLNACSLCNETCSIKTKINHNINDNA